MRRSFGGRGKRLLVVREIHVLPFAADDAFADLRGGLAFVGLLVGIERFADADVAGGAMAADEAVEQAGVALVLVAVAVAGLLVEDAAGATGDEIGVADEGFAKECGAHRRGERAPGEGGVVGGDAGVGGLRRRGGHAQRAANA